MDPSLCKSLRFSHREVDIPKGNEAKWNESAGMAVAPTFNVPIVVSLEADECQLVVFRFGEDLTTKAGEGREAHRGKDPVGIHIVDAGVNVPTALAHFVEACGVNAVFGSWAACDRIEPDVGELQVVVDPDIVPIGIADNMRSFVPGAIPGRQMLFEKIGRLHHVIIN